MTVDDDPKTRRSQEQRRRATTNKLIDATIEVVNESGYSGLKASTITKRAGVTWGAVQHLFGNKENLLITVANRTYEELSLALRADISTESALEDRVGQIIEVTLRAYQTEAYLAMVEILRGSRAHEAFNKELLKRQRMVSEDVRNTWLALFSNSGHDDATIDRAMNLVTLTLSGLAARKIFLKGNRGTDEIVTTLKYATLCVLEQEANPQAHRKPEETPLIL